ncbi:amidohydrolase family protein [Tautonia rosea]|uniref:amidohydrolase family protein n=1 Tax=Tautonia rosea TaxID=2728037 RepID=UPI00147315F3|nr:amidohydrolase family protein [Tautonia rosea]
MRARLLLLAPMLLLSGLPATASTTEVVAYRAARLWTGDGPPIVDAVLLVADGRIIEVGSRSDVEVPETARRVNLGPSAVVIPGLVAAESGLGVVSADDERALTPGVRAIDGFDPFADFNGPLSGGVTTVHLSPGRNRLMPGRGAVVKLAGIDPAARTLEAEGDLRIVLAPDALNPPRIYEPPPRLVARDRPVDPTQPQLASSLAGAVAGLRSLIEAARADRPEAGTDPLLDPLAEALADTARVRVTAPGAAEVRAALSLAGTFDLKLVLVGPTDLRPWLDRLDSWGETVDAVVLDPRSRPGRIAELPLPDPDAPAPRDAWDDAAALVDAGVAVAVVPSTDDDLNELLFLASQFAAGGFSDEQVLRMITAAPAELLGVGDRIGTLASGKDADFVVLSADPFDLHTQVREVYVSGRRAWSVDAEPKAIVIRASSVQLGDGSELADASIVVQDGTIRGVGPDVSAPSDAEMITFGGSAVVTPGLIDLATDLGLGGPLSESPRPSSSVVGGGGDEDDSSADQGGGPSRTSVGLDTKLGDRLVAGDPAVEVARRGGITTVLTGPRDLSPAPVVAFKLGDSPAVLRDPVALRFRLSGNATASASSLRSTLRRAKAYADSWEKYAADLAEYESKKKDYEEAKARLDAKKRAEEARKKAEEARTKTEDAKSKDSEKSDDESKDESKETPDSKDDAESEDKEKGESREKSESTDEPESKDEKTAAETAEDELPEEPKAPKKPNTVASLEPYRPLFSRSIPALVEVGPLDTIREALKLFYEEFSLKTVLIGADDAFRDPGVLADAEVPAVIGPDLIRRVDRETVNLAQVLATRGVPFGFQSQAGSGSATLPRAVRYAVRLGLGTGDALSGLSSSPAVFLGLEDRIGTIAPGRDADLVVWSGPPFSPASRVLAVMIDGSWVYFSREDER